MFTEVYCLSEMYLFPGGNTPRRFVNHFDDILPFERARRVYFIKGGSGVGKSTFMRAVGQHCAQAGYKVEYFNCSSDPQSLDGVAIPALGAAMMDGTAPHVMDPRLPGARDFMINLGDYLDEGRLSELRPWLSDVMQRRTQCFERAYAYLGAAGQIYARAGRETMDSRKPRAALVREVQSALGLMPEQPPATSTGRLRHLFADAFTPEGRFTTLGTLPVRRSICLKLAWGGSASDVLNELADMFTGAGQDAIILLNPMRPDDSLHLYVPAREMLISSFDGLFEYNVDVEAVIDARASITAPEFARAECLNMIDRATKCLSDARTLHADVEHVYSAAMDFDGANVLRGEICAQIDELMP